MDVLYSSSTKKGYRAKCDMYVTETQGLISLVSELNMKKKLKIKSVLAESSMVATCSPLFTSMLCTYVSMGAVL
jgi:hypothetical protein